MVFLDSDFSTVEKQVRSKVESYDSDCDRSHEGSHSFGNECVDGFRQLTKQFDYRRLWKYMRLLRGEEIKLYFMYMVLCQPYSVNIGRVIKI